MLLGLRQCKSSVESQLWDVSKKYLGNILATCHRHCQVTVESTAKVASLLDIVLAPAEPDPGRADSQLTRKHRHSSPRSLLRCGRYDFHDLTYSPPLSLRAASLFKPRPAAAGIRASLAILLAARRPPWVSDSAAQRIDRTCMYHHPRDRCSPAPDRQITLIASWPTAHSDDLASSIARAEAST